MSPVLQTLFQYVSAFLLVALASFSVRADQPRIAIPYPVAHPLKVFGGRLGQRADHVLYHFANGTRITHERPFVEIPIPNLVMGLESGITISQLEKVRTKGFSEMVHVVGADGSTNLEYIILRLPFIRQQFIELQGPAINHTANGRLGFRLLGLGVTGDFNEKHSPKAVSYTAEVKVTDKTVTHLLRRFAPEATHFMLRALAPHHASDSIAAYVVPGVSIGLAAYSIRSAIHAWRSPHHSKRSRFLATSQAIADTIRVPFPMLGVMANVALIAGNGVYEMFRLRHRFSEHKRALASSNTPHEHKSLAKHLKHRKLPRTHRLKVQSVARNTVDGKTPTQH